ncbi:MAG: DUF6362 family protein [Geminicoccaceae bacterium]
MRWAPRGFGGDRIPPGEMKRLGWQAQRVLVIDADDDRLTWPERELVRQLGERLYGCKRREETRHEWIGHPRRSRSVWSKPLPCCGACRRCVSAVIFSTWPRMKVEFSDLVGQTPEPMRLPPPSASEISRMEQALGWFTYLEQIVSRIVWKRVSGKRWKEVCWEVGLARAAAHEHWMYAPCLIAWRLNGGGGLTRLGRRAAIARVRAGWNRPASW